MADISGLTCLKCCLRFHNLETMREHYKSDWHRYNLKRAVAELPPVTAEEFQKRVLQHREASEQATKDESQYCQSCRKQFGTVKSYDNHLKSKQHLAKLEKFEVEQEAAAALVEEEESLRKLTEKYEETMQDEDDDDDDIEEVDSDEWDEEAENPIAQHKCMFCDQKSEDFVANMSHMSKEHSFFVPDTEYVTDLEGLMLYLGEKISRDFICLWCNERGRTFQSVDAVRKHMMDKGHCKMLHDGLALAEYADFYDYSTSYPDNDEGMDIDEEIAPTVLEGDEFQMVLPSGVVIGHRSLMRYYKQRLNPERALVVSKSNKKLHKVLAEYRSLGWTQTQQAAAAKKARDIHHMKRTYQRWYMNLGCKANKLQRHFRPQVEI